MLRAVSVALSCSLASAVLHGSPVALRPAVPLASPRTVQQRHCSQSVRPRRQAVLHRAPAPQMQAQNTDFFEDFVLTNEDTGEVTTLDFKEKEKLYLDCLDAFYNDGGKKLLPDDQFDKLKLDLDFEGSKVT